MAIQAYELRQPWDGEACGAILVCTTSGRVLNLPIRTFVDCDDADAFVAVWPEDPRRLTDEDLEKAVAEWRAFQARYPVNDESLARFEGSVREMFAESRVSTIGGAQRRLP